MHDTFQERANAPKNNVTVVTIEDTGMERIRPPDSYLSVPEGSWT